MESPYFQSSSIRRTNRKTKTFRVAATLLTAVASASIPTMVDGFSPKPHTPPSSTIKGSTKRQPAVTPPSSEKIPKRHKTGLTSKDRPEAPLTNSFEPLWSNQSSIPVHALILGSHPSVQSLERQQYYGHPMNAFWWIAGDCLGFRRGRGISESTGRPYAFCQDLRFGPERSLSYPRQVERLVLSGFALWDVVGSCQRPGSLDQDIRNETPNAIREFCRQQGGSLRRIVLANGGTGSKLFVKHFGEWLESGELQVPSDHVESQKAFAKAIERGRTKRAIATLEDDINNKILVISAMGVSPANARFSYTAKRDMWEEYVYQPGLRDHVAYKTKIN